MTRMSKIDITCSAARLLEREIEPDDLDRIRQETGCTRRQSEKISDSMKNQISFMRWLDRLEESLRA